MNLNDSIGKIQNYSSGFQNADEFYSDTLTFDAVLMNFIVIGEMAGKLSEEFIEKTSKLIDWSKIKSFRNIIAHNYFGVDAEEVWQIIQNDLQALADNLSRSMT